MALTRPILASVGAFDATQAFTFTFSVIGGDSVVGNTLTIANQATGATVYNQSVTATDYTHTLPANTLTNGTTYTAYVQTKNEAGELSPQSNVIQFNCYAAATLTFSNMPTSNIIPSAEFEFEATYSQAEGDSVSNYIFNLYDVQGVLVSTSNVLYLPSASAPPTTLSYTFSGFADNSRYLVECVVNAVSGQRVTTGRVEITVRYEAPIITGGITVSPNCQDGYMQGYIDWRQVPAGVDKLRIKRRKANEFNWTTIKEFDNRERQLAMIEKPQSGIEKFYDVNNEGVAIVKQAGISSRNAASTADDGETWTLGTSFGSGSPDQIVGDYVANKGVGGYIDKNGQKYIYLPVEIPSNLTITTYGINNSSTPCAVMTPNSSDGIYWDGYGWKVHNHFPNVAHPCLYYWRMPYGGGSHMVCHDYDTKKLYYISFDNLKANNVDWAEVTFGIDSTTTRPTLTDIFSFVGYVHAYDANTRKIYFLQYNYWESVITVPTSIGTVTGIAATYDISEKAGPVTMYVITSNSGCYIVNNSGNIVASNTSLSVAGRTTGYPSIVDGWARTQSADGKYYGMTLIADRYTGRVFGFSHPSGQSNVVHWCEPVDFSNVKDITTITDEIGRKAYSVATTTDGIIASIVAVDDGTNFTMDSQSEFSSFYYPSNYNGYVDVSTPVVINPYGDNYNSGIDPYFIGGDIYALAPQAQLIGSGSNILRLQAESSTFKDSAVVNIAGTNKDNVFMAMAKNYVNIRKDAEDTTMRYDGAWSKLATIGAVSEEDISDVVLSSSADTSITFNMNSVTEYTAVDTPSWVGIPIQHIRQYTGDVIEAMYNVDTNLVNVTGDTSATNAGDYYITFTLKDTTQYRWADGGISPIVLKWIIQKARVATPSLTNKGFTYTGNVITPELSYNSTLSTATGDFSATNAGDYKIVVTLNDPANYQWEDSSSGDSSPEILNWWINEAFVPVPTLPTTTFEYTGDVITPTINNLDTNLVNVTGDTSATNAGDYSITFSLKDKDNYRWADYMRSDKTVKWKIAQIVAVPNLAATDYEYNPLAATSPVFTNVDTSIVTLSGDTSKNDVGTYSITVTLPNETLYSWSDGTTAPKSYAWDIVKTGLFFNYEDVESAQWKFNQKNWDGTLQVSTDGYAWVTWSSADYRVNSTQMWLRGIGNSVINGNLGETHIVASDGMPAIKCYGNIELLLDYNTVANGEHPVMGSYAFTRMFDGMSLLASSPELPATTLSSNCYSGMFAGCTSLVSAPDLPADYVPIGSYNAMFSRCTSLITPPVLSFTRVSGAGCAYMFAGCTSLVTAPALKATSIGINSYNGMFENCTSLVSIPVLPATVLNNFCYDDMFAGCVKVKLSETQTGEYTIPYRIPVSGTGTVAIDALRAMFTGTGGTFTGTPTINTTYYLSNTNSIVE